MKKVTINIYKFSELSEDVKQKVLERQYDINVFGEWWECTYEDAETVGLKINEFDIDRGSYCKGEFLLSANEVAQNILNEHGENCETHKTADNFMSEWQPVFNNYMDETHENYESGELEDELMDLENEFLNELLEDYRIMLSREFDYLTSDEAIIETINCNDYDFTGEGEIYARA